MERLLFHPASALLSMRHRGTPGQAGHPQGSTGGTNQLVIPSPLGLPFSAAASPASKNEENQRVGHFWTFPLTGNYLFFFL